MMHAFSLTNKSFAIWMWSPHPYVITVSIRRTSHIKNRYWVHFMYMQSSEINFNKLLSISLLYLAFDFVTLLFHIMISWYVSWRNVVSVSICKAHYFVYLRISIQKIVKISSNNSLQKVYNHTSHRPHLWTQISFPYV